MAIKLIKLNTREQKITHHSLQDYDTEDRQVLESSEMERVLECFPGRCTDLPPSYTAAATIHRQNVKPQSKLNRKSLLVLVGKLQQLTLAPLTNIS